MILNYTPHELMVGDDYFYNSLPFKKVPRIATPKPSFTEVLNGFNINHYLHYKTYNLPPVRDSTIYIVSRDVARLNPDRFDLICPDTTINSAVKNNKGSIMGVTSFSSFYPKKISDFFK